MIKASESVQNIFLRLGQKSNIIRTSEKREIAMFRNLIEDVAELASVSAFVVMVLYWSQAFV